MTLSEMHEFMRAHVAAMILIRSTSNDMEFKASLDHAIPVFENVVQFLKSSDERKIANLEEDLRSCRAQIASMRELFREGAVHLTGNPANYPESMRRFVYLLQEEALK